MFNVGDRVKILQNIEDENYDEYIGTEGVITEITKDEPSIEVQCYNNELLWWYTDELELIPQGIQVKIKRLSPDSVVPTYATPGSACFDLVATEDTIIQPGETKAISTGVAFEIPEGYQMKIHPRSGISLKTPLRVANAPESGKEGCIDSDYRGELKVLLWNTLIDKNEDCNWYTTIDGMESRGLSYKLPLGSYGILKGDRIAQAEIVPVIRASFTEVDQLSTTERTGGFGSTGTRGVL